MIGLATTSIAGSSSPSSLVGWIVYAFLNNGSARKEVGSEIELAANRKPYYDDEVLEGKRLERVQLLGVLLLVVIVIGLPLYWVFEPSRQAGATEGLEKRLAGWGVAPVRPDGGRRLQLRRLPRRHDRQRRSGAVHRHRRRDPGRCRSVNWNAPALNTVLYRFDEDEVRYILTYGRPGSPMSAWGLDGGGPMNAQQIQTLIEYLKSIQIPREDCLAGGGGRPELPERPPARRRPGRHRDARPPARRRRHVLVLRRGAVQPRPRQRRLQLRPLPHQGLELRRSRRARAGRLRLEPHRRQHDRQVPEPRRR